MATFVYKCKACETQMELCKGMTEPHYTTCPKCGGELQHVFLPVNIHYRGSGFTHTDSALDTPVEGYDYDGYDGGPVTDKSWSDAELDL